MRKSLVILALGALALGACRTTEENYRAAYEVAKARVDESNTDNELDPEVQAKIKAVNRSHMAKYVAGKDTIETFTMFLSRVDSDDAPVPEFSVAVHGFEQKFNALAMMKRLRANGFAGAYVLRNANQTYYVISSGTDTVAKIPEMIIQAKSGAAALGLAKGYPLVLRNPNHHK